MDKQLHEQRKAVDRRRRCSNGYAGLCGCMTRDGGCMRCGSGLHVEVDGQGICRTCRETEQVREVERRLQALVVQDGSRQRMAAVLARQCELYEPNRSAPQRWAFIWEMTGERAMLRKLVELLYPHMDDVGEAGARPSNSLGKKVR